MLRAWAAAAICRSRTVEALVFASEDFAGGIVASYKRWLERYLLLVLELSVGSRDLSIMASRLMQRVPYGNSLSMQHKEDC